MALRAAVSMLSVAFLCGSCATGDLDDDTPREDESGEVGSRSGAQDRWITMGADAVASVTESFQVAGVSQEFTIVASKNGVAIAKVKEARLPVIAQVMHEKYNRCAGFIAHASFDEAVEAANAAAAAEQQEPELAVDYSINNAAVVQALLGQVQAANVRQTIVSLSAYPTRYYTSTSGVERGGDLAEDALAGLCRGPPRCHRRAEGAHRLPAAVGDPDDPGDHAGQRGGGARRPSGLDQQRRRQRAGRRR
jgi:leucyl aminopeptidase